MIAILADTHLPKGGRRIPERCLELLAAADAIVHAGDLAAVSVLVQLEALGPPVHAVHGNVDEPELQRSLPAELSLELDGVRLAVTHDAGPAQGRLERLRLRFPDADAVVFGHSHMPLHEEAGGFHVFNPGSPTERRRAPRHSMGLMRATAQGPRFEHVWLDRDDR